MQGVGSTLKYEFQSSYKMRRARLYTAPGREMRGFRSNKLLYLYVPTKLKKYKYKEFQAELLKHSFLSYRLPHPQILGCSIISVRAVSWLRRLAAGLSAETRVRSHISLSDLQWTGLSPSTSVFPCQYHSTSATY
jgi:hypothetical protein